VSGVRIAIDSRMVGWLIGVAGSRLAAVARAHMQGLFEDIQLRSHETRNHSNLDSGTVLTGRGCVISLIITPRGPNRGIALGRDW
jgi:hypothetical protein